MNSARALLPRLRPSNGSFGRRRRRQPAGVTSSTHAFHDGDDFLSRQPIHLRRASVAECSTLVAAGAGVTSSPHAFHDGTTFLSMNATRPRPEKSKSGRRRPKSARPPKTLYPVQCRIGSQSGKGFSHHLRILGGSTDQRERLRSQPQPIDLRRASVAECSRRRQPAGVTSSPRRSTIRRLSCRQLGALRFSFCSHLFASSKPPFH